MRDREIGASHVVQAIGRDETPRGAFAELRLAEETHREAEDRGGGEREREPRPAPAQIGCLKDAGQ
jgi:hypothetical protein